MKSQDTKQQTAEDESDDDEEEEEEEREGKPEKIKDLVLCHVRTLSGRQGGGEGAAVCGWRP